MFGSIREKHTKAHTIYKKFGNPASSITLCMNEKLTGRHRIIADRDGALIEGRSLLQTLVDEKKQTRPWLTVLVCRERTSGMTIATVIPSKGSCGTFMTDRVMKFLEECGDQVGDIIITTDQ